MKRFLPILCLLLCLMLCITSTACADTFFMAGDWPIIHRDPLCPKLPMTDEPLRTLFFASLEELESAAETYYPDAHCCGLYPEFTAQTAPLDIYYFNPNGGNRLHADADCPSIDESSRPLQGVCSAADGEAKGLSLCPHCTAQSIKAGAFSYAACFDPLEKQAALLPGVWTLPSPQAISPDAAYNLIKAYLNTAPEIQASFPDGLFTLGITHYDVGTEEHPTEMYKALVTTVLRAPVGVICIDAVTGEIYGGYMRME